MTGIHLEGMGVIGSVAAHRLHEAGIPFTWEDARRDRNAYRASAGGVYPINTTVPHAAVSQNAFWAWLTAANASAFGSGVTEMCDYLYNTQSAPFSQSWKPAARRGGLNVAPNSVVAVNTRQLVESARARFAAEEAPAAPEAKRFIMHGFGPRLAAYGWGCTAVMELPDEGRFREGGKRPLMSLFASRAVRLYVVPLPGTPLYVVGSTIRVKQQQPESLDGRAYSTARHYKALLRKLAGIDGIIHEIRQGWRPLAHEGDPALLQKVDDRTWATRPAAGSGVAQAFEYAWAVMAEARA